MSNLRIGSKTSTRSISRKKNKNKKGAGKKTTSFEDVNLLLKIADLHNTKFELAGLLIEYGFLDENLYFDRYGSLQKEWEKAQPIIYGIRKQWNSPHFRENFEILALRGKNWTESHLSKIK